jgi:NitT/TauT family transport system substrate-binding protein
MQQHNLSRRSFLSLFGAATLTLAGCGAQQSATSGSAAPAGSAAAPAGSAGSATQAASGNVVRVGSLTGPTTIGMVDLMQHAEAGETTNTYDFTLAGTADEIVPQVIQGNLDIALLPANACSVIWNKTKGGVYVIDINTLGVLYVVTGDAGIATFEDLAGRTVYMTGKGQTPEYVMNYLLGATNIADQVTLEFKSEPAEVVSALAADSSAVGVLPQPFVTAACVKNPDLSAPISLTDVWDATVDDGSRMVTGATIVRKEFADANPEAVAAFLADHAESVEAVNADPEAAAALVVKYGIIEAEPVAAKAIPNCSLVCITGDEMKKALSGYLAVLASADPSAVGGAAPDDTFYYAG